MEVLKDIERKKLLDKICEVHSCQLWESPVVIAGKLKYLQVCPECEKEEIKRIEKKLNNESAINSKLAQTFEVFSRFSLFPDELIGKNLENFSTDNQSADQGLNFSKRMLRDYVKGETGNVIITGPPGVGKSHLSIALASSLNNKFKDLGTPKSIIFVSVTRLFSEIENSFGGKGDFIESYAVEMLSNVDYLFLDDLGKESSMSDTLKQANEWRQRVLFKILDNRQTTFINTNLSSSEIKKIYNSALADRIFKGASKHIFKFPDGMESRRY